jgi:hypothetical protein
VSVLILIFVREELKVSNQNDFESKEGSPACFHHCLGSPHQERPGGIIKKLFFFVANTVRQMS